MHSVEDLLNNQNIFLHLILTNITMKKKIKVLVVDDSAVVRKIISTTLGKHEDIEVVGTAPDPL